jgi:hypothetical protein
MKVSEKGWEHLPRLYRNKAAMTCGGKVLITLEGGCHRRPREGVRSVLNTFDRRPIAQEATHHPPRSR